MFPAEPVKKYSPPVKPNLYLPKITSEVVILFINVHDAPSLLLQKYESVQGSGPQKTTTAFPSSSRPITYPAFISSDPSMKLTSVHVEPSSSLYLTTPLLGLSVVSVPTVTILVVPETSRVMMPPTTYSLAVPSSIFDTWIQVAPLSVLFARYAVGAVSPASCPTTYHASAEEKNMSLTVVKLVVSVTPEIIFVVHAAPSVVSSILAETVEPSAATRANIFVGAKSIDVKKPLNNPDGEISAASTHETPSLILVLTLLEAAPFVTNQVPSGCTPIIFAVAPDGAEPNPGVASIHVCVNVCTGVVTVRQLDADPAPSRLSVALIHN